MGGNYRTGGEFSFPAHLINKSVGKNGKMGLLKITSVTKRNLIVMGTLMIDVNGGELRE